MTSAPLLIATLEDDERRTGAMCVEIERVFPDAKAVFIDNAPDMIGWLEKNLPSVALLCLDHDLGPNRRRDGGGSSTPASAATSRTFWPHGLPDVRSLFTRPTLSEPTGCSSLWKTPDGRSNESIPSAI